MAESKDPTYPSENAPAHYVSGGSDGLGGCSQRQRRRSHFTTTTNSTPTAQQTCETFNPPTDPLASKIIKALMDKLNGYTNEQCSVLVKNMSKLTLPSNTMVEDDGLCYVESGTMKSSGKVSIPLKSIIMKDTLFGNVFTEVHNDDQEKGSLITQDQCIVWKISRLKFQEVLVAFSKAINTNKIAIIPSIPILAPLSHHQQQKVANMMKEVEFPAGTTIIAAGTKGTTMYFIKSGKITINKVTRGEAESVVLDTQVAGDYFGETALLNEGEDVGTRTADCIASEPTVCYTLERADVLRLLGPLQDLMTIKSKAQALNHVELLHSTTTESQREKIASLMEKKHYKLGEQIIKQGEPGDEFFIIADGEVKFTRVQENMDALSEAESLNGKVEDIGTLFAHQFFGEGSLLDLKPRRATATASQEDTTCYVLSGSKFRELFGTNNKIILEMRKVLDTRKQADALSATLIVEEKSNETNTATDAATDAGTDAGTDAATDAATTKRNLMSKTYSSHLLNYFIKPDELNAISVLGEGSYGKVTLVRHKTTGRTFAVKQITKKHVKKMKQEKHIETERKVIACINHPFVCNLVRTFKNKHSVYFLMEAVLGGELYAQLKICEKFSPKQGQMYVAQVCSVFEHLHLHDIIFRDLKPENLLIAQDGYLKMVDFGLAKIVPDGKTYTLCGTPAYAAPEVYASRGHDKGVDWWTLGILLRKKNATNRYCLYCIAKCSRFSNFPIYSIHIHYSPDELLAGYTPFYGKEPNQIHREITRFSKHYPKVSFPKHFSRSASSLCLQLLHPSPSKRIGNLKNGSKDVKMSLFLSDINWKKLSNKEYTPEFIPSINDSFDTQNFNNNEQQFERTIDDDDKSFQHEEWSSKF